MAYFNSITFRINNKMEKVNFRTLGGNLGEENCN